MSDKKHTLPMRALCLLSRLTGGREPLMLIALLLAAGAIWAFAEISDEVVEGDTHAFDRRVLLALRTPGDPTDPIGPRYVEEMVRDFTALGGYGVQVLLVAGVIGYLLLYDKRRTALLIALAIGSGLIASNLLKYGFDRPRPDLVPHGSIIYTSSFPSGHSMMSAITYLTLGSLLARVQPKKRLKAYILGMAMLTTLLVGFSRVYLGVHWPTDVFGGWAAGAAWAFLFWYLALYLELHSPRKEEPGEGA